jgi:hypothetical protein
MIDQLEKIAFTLLGCPVRVVCESEGVSSPSPGAFGVTARKLDLLPSFLEARCDQHGRQPAIFIADVLLRESIAAECPAADVDRIFDKWLCAILAHELGHLVEVGIDDSECTPQSMRVAAGIVAYSNAMQDSPAKVPPFFAHGPNWIRPTLHVRHRMAALGLDTPVEYLFVGADYAIADPDDWQFALMGEEQALANVSIWEIKNFRPPQTFRDLWQRCVARWRDENKNFELDWLGRDCLDRALTLFS